MLLEALASKIRLPTGMQDLALRWQAKSGPMKMITHLMLIREVLTPLMLKTQLSICSLPCLWYAHVLLQHQCVF